MENRHYWVYAVDKEGYVIGQKRLTNEENLAKCIEMTKHDMGVNLVHLNEAVICFDGYYVQGEYLRTR